MGTEQQAIERVIRWRFEGLWVRLGQAALVAPLAWVATSSPLVPAWFVVSSILSLLDAACFAGLHRRPNSALRRATALTMLAVSTTAFSSIGLLLLVERSPVTMAGAMLILCAINLNNAVMTRGWPLASRLAIGASSAMILGSPLAAFLYGVGLTDCLVLEAGGLTYVAFIGILVSTLRREGEVLHRMLESQEHQRDYVRQAKEGADRARARWSMLFDQSPLPQVCFDGSRLYELLRPHAEAGETRLGDVLQAKVSKVSKALDYLALTEANAASEALFGVTRFNGAMDNRHFDASFLAGFCESLNGLDGQGVFPPFDAKVRRDDGGLVDVAVHIRTIPGSERPWTTCIATYVDVTEMRSAERAQREAVLAAEAANRAKSEFLAIMSHEIRTPLNGVLGMVQAMARDKLAKPQRERLDIIGQSGAALLTILNDILDLSKIEAGKLELEAAEFDLGQLAEGAHAAFRDLAERKGLVFELTVEPGAEGVYRGDSVRVRQILSNLISNALKFTAEGSVRVVLRPAEAGVRMEVSDTGVGVAPERIERLFDKFVQEDSSTTRRFGGTGLGLSICNELVRAMGGVISVTSEVGRGSVFTVDVPLARIGDAGAPTVAPEEVLANAGDRTLRILAAEDNAVNQLVLKTLLGQAGLEPVIVGDGEAAVAAWEAGEWDVILMDVQMPLMDGPTATRAIRRREAETGRAHTPIIALTANAMTHQADSYRAAGMDGFVAKPIEVGALFEAIATAVGVVEGAESAAA